MALKHIDVIDYDTACTTGASPGHCSAIRRGGCWEATGNVERLDAPICAASESARAWDSDKQPVCAAVLVRIEDFGEWRALPGTGPKLQRTGAERTQSAGGRTCSESDAVELRRVRGAGAMAA